MDERRRAAERLRQAERQYRAAQGAGDPARYRVALQELQEAELAVLEMLRGR